ncbi:MAG TPA: PsiF family protein [Steroidobacteraceae bacterium]|jgi:hypothetical protein
MKILTAFAAIAIVASAAAVAADPPATPSAIPVKHPSLKTCNKQADAKKLAGKERAHFVLDCRAGKTP